MVFKVIVTSEPSCTIKDDASSSYTGIGVGVLVGVKVGVEVGVGVGVGSGTG